MACSTVVGLLNWKVSISSLRYRFGGQWPYRLSLFARGLNGGDDVGVGSTAANIAVHGLFDILICRANRLLEESDGRHYLARRAVAALVSVVLDEGSLHRVKMVRLADAFDSRDFVH